MSLDKNKTVIQNTLERLAQKTMDFMLYAAALQKRHDRGFRISNRQIEGLKNREKEIRTICEALP